MSFDRIDYLGWYVPRVRSGDGALNLHSSGMPPIGPEHVTAPPFDPWIWVASLEAKLGRWLGIEAEEIMFTHGATGGTLFALMVLGRPGSAIIVEQPVYEPLLRQAERLGPIRRLPRRVERGWRFNLDEARTLIAGEPPVSMVMITEPHNPSGVHAPPEDVLALADIAAERGALLLVNEVYRGWSERPSYHGAAANIVVTDSLTKLFGAYWARVGWISAAAERVAALRPAYFNVGMPSAPAAAVGISLMKQADALRERARNASQAGVEIVEAWVQETAGVSWQKPEGPGYGCVRLPAGMDDMAFAERLHDDHGVMVVPGTLWESPGSLRIGWLQTSPEDLRTGLARIAEQLPR